MSFRRKPEAIFTYSKYSWMPFFNGMTFHDGVAEKVTSAETVLLINRQCHLVKLLSNGLIFTQTCRSPFPFGVGIGIGIGIVIFQSYQTFITIFMPECPLKASFRVSSLCDLRASVVNLLLLIFSLREPLLLFSPHPEGNYPAPVCKIYFQILPQKKRHYEIK